jgi:uncharacterized protein (TIGR03083 family)
VKPPEPVRVVELFPEERDALLDLLRGLSPDEWNLPTVCEGWTVKDVALHVLGGDLGVLSRHRDGFAGTPLQPGDDIVSLVNRINYEWVATTRRLSTRVLVDLLAFTGPQIHDLFASLDLDSVGGSVSWAGLEQAPVWLDVAREYTERWLHQQHIREAVGKPGFAGRRHLAPVLATYVYALPPAFRDIAAPEGTLIQLHIEGESGGDWSLQRVGADWSLLAGAPEPEEPAGAAALVAIDESLAWRLFTKGISPEEAAPQVRFEGDRELGGHALGAVAIIA